MAGGGGALRPAKPGSQAAGHALGVDDQAQAGQGLGRVALVPGQDAINQRAREIHPRREGENARVV